MINIKGIKGFDSLVTRIKRNGLFLNAPRPDAKGIDGEINLFRTVLDKTLFLCFSPNPEDRKEAREYFALFNVDFLMVCQLAHINARDVLSVYNKLMEDYGDESYKIRKGRSGRESSE